ncbi:histidine kinase [Microbacterium sp. ZW T5_56]|uniref:sensor histidine kinase n=1 Tax=Microbacterium sp. ZW T5_56 TaxID=3378081 RepID=UPI003855607D
MSATVWDEVRRPPHRFLFGAMPWRSLGYLVFSVVWGLFWLLVMIPTLLLIPLWALVVGTIERRRTRWLGFAAQPSPHVRVPRPERRHWLNIRLLEPATWREVGALFSNLVFGLLALVLVGAEITVLVLCVAFVWLSVSESGRVVTLWGDVSWALTPERTPFLVIAFLLMLVVGAYAHAVLAGAQASLLRLLCAPRDAELQSRVEQLTAARATLVRALDEERRRIERDLHDGVQQELVALGARLAIIELEAEAVVATGTTDPLLRAVGTARSAADAALDSLRRTVRGLHPAVLSDRGLTAALQELAGRAPVPLRLELDVPRLPAAAETAAYYLVTEALSNAAKHSGASLVSAEAQVEHGELVVTVSDDGGGTVAEDRGTGVAGLRERAASLGGTLTVSTTTGRRSGVLLSMRIPVSAYEERGHGAHPAG